MKLWERFTSFKQRGEWVELQFMAQAAKRCLAVSKPWGDMQAYDVGIEHGQNFLRVQVKSTTSRSGAGYRCMFKPNYLKKCDYSLDQIDVFAAYVIPEDAWYLIPAALLLGTRRLTPSADIYSQTNGIHQRAHEVHLKHPIWGTYVFEPLALNAELNLALRVL
jgi:hypothetical protein